MAIEIIRVGARVMQKNCVLWVKWEQSDGEKRNSFQRYREVGETGEN